jgi:hypothetical protein
VEREAHAIADQIRDERIKFGLTPDCDVVNYSEETGAEREHLMMISRPMTQLLD